MTKKADTTRRIIWEGDSTILPDRVHYRLVKVGRRGYLEIEDGAQRLAPIPIPPDRKTLDLPLWMASILACKIKDAPGDRLDAMEWEIRRLLTDAEKTVTICMGPRRQAHRAAIFHLAHKGKQTGRELEFVRRIGSTIITIKGEIAAPVVISDPDHLQWEFSLIAKSEEDAKAIERQYQWDSVLSFDERLVAILAVSAEHWEAVGITEGEVREIAEKQSLRLLPVRKRGKLGLSFLAFPIAGVSS